MPKTQDKARNHCFKFLVCQWQRFWQGFWSIYLKIYMLNWMRFRNRDCINNTPQWLLQEVLFTRNYPHPHLRKLCQIIQFSMFFVSEPMSLYLFNNFTFVLQIYDSMFKTLLIYTVVLHNLTQAQIYEHVDGI